MTLLTWAIRLFIFCFLVIFALQNTDVVTLHLLLGQTWQGPLVIVLLAFFAGGALLGVLSVLGVLYRQRREIARLQRDAVNQAAKPISDVPPAV